MKGAWAALATPSYRRSRGPGSSLAPGWVGGGAQPWGQRHTPTHPHAHVQVHMRTQTQTQSQKDMLGRMLTKRETGAVGESQKAREIKMGCW